VNEGQICFMWDGSRNYLEFVMMHETLVVEKVFLLSNTIYLLLLNSTAGYCSGMPILTVSVQNSC